MDLSDTIKPTMFKGRLGGCTGGGFKAQSVYVETDPSGRYGRFRDVLGKGAMKTVYRAFDELLGIEVAWNQVKLGDAFHSPDQLQRLYSEVHLLKHLSHDSMMIFYGSWIDIDRRTFNFITELFTSGTLREYRQKYKTVDIRAVKNWARQILSGLEYLHSNNPPVIHRDLKCDNIFVNGHLGQVKIGDLGLAAILRSSQNVAHSVIGTPEFMAPELYEEQYNELVDIYSFGMCMIEMLTFEFPYSECLNPAQIYKKVTSGKLPKAFYKIKDLEAQRFVGKCLAPVSKRPPAKKLLLDPFLSSELIELPVVVPVTLSTNQPQKLNSNAAAATAVAIENLSMCNQIKSTDMTITGSINEEGNTVFLKVQICDTNGKTRNVFFPFDTIKDTSIEVAMEMVRDLEITHLEPLEIAAMIDDEISVFVPTWRDRVTTICKHQRQHSFNYEEDEDINNHHPFFLSSYSSPSSPHGSIVMTGSSYKNLLRGNHCSFVPEWHQDDLLLSCMNDDSSSPSSMNSMKSSSVQYYCDSSNNEEALNNKLEASFCKKLICNPRIMHPASCICGNNNNDNNGSSKLRLFPRLTRIRSFVDERRSQHLQRLLILEEAFKSKRRMFNSVGAMENIGFKHPAERGGGGGGCCGH